MGTAVGASLQVESGRPRPAGPFDFAQGKLARRQPLHRMTNPAMNLKDIGALPMRDSEPQETR